MENKDDILKKIKSDDPQLRAEAWQNIKEEGDITIVPALLQLLLSVTDHQITTELISLLSDIKENAFKELLIGQIRTTTAAGPKSLLLRICWESSLDFSAHAPLLAEIVLNDDFIAALEAATTLENMTLPPEKQTEILTYLQKETVPEEKQFLIDNIVNEWSAKEQELPEEKQ